MVRGLEDPRRAPHRRAGDRPNRDWWLHAPKKQTVTVRGGSITLPFLPTPRADTIAGDPGTQLSSYLAEQVTPATEFSLP